MMFLAAIPMTARDAIKSVSALTAMSFASLPRRLGTAAVVILGIGGVVAVLIAVLAMGSGIDKSIAGSGRDDRALVLRAGAGLELLSLLNRPQVSSIVAAPGVKRDAQSRPIASAEALALIELRLMDDTPVNVPLRGVSRTEVLRPEIAIAAGRMFRPGVPEVVVGAAAQSQFRNLQIGASIVTREATWKVVGSFASSGNLRDSELLTDADMVMSAYQRKTYQSVLVQLESAAAFSNFSAALAADPSLQVDVTRESGYYASLARPLSNSFRRLAYLVGGIMAAGALFATLSCVHAAVSSRAREIATLRALGFGAPSVVCAVILETLLLALTGGGIGVGLCWLAFSGKTLSTSGGGVVQMTYTMAVTSWPIVIGLLWASGIGVFAGLLPALHAARQPIPSGLRAI